MIFTPLDIILICGVNFMSGSILTLIMTLRYLKNNMEQEQVVVAQSVPEPSRAMIYVQRE
tara:strand:- start:148 stop:327 length:180 start_codon:yes stop_codon:yes gene_type:complete